MAFPAIQAAYAAHGVATYPLTAGKVPAVRAYDRIRAPYSAQLALKFADAIAAGFVAGRRNRLTIVDVDSTDHRLVDEMERLLGSSPLHVQTPSGGWHAYFRHDGEPRAIRALPYVDLLGVRVTWSLRAPGRPRGAIPSSGARSTISTTCPACWPPQPRHRPPSACRWASAATLVRLLPGGIVGHCDTFDQLLDAARTWVEGRLAEPLHEAEIAKTCSSVWTYRGGRKRIMNHIVESPIYSKLVDNMDALALFAYLSAENGLDAEFMVANGIAEARGWPRRSVQNARKALIELQIIKCVRPPRKGAPALYRWRLPT